MEMSAEIKDLAAALAKAQSKIDNATKSSTNPHFKSKYADLAEVLNTVRPVLSEHGISVTQMPGMDGDNVTLTTLMMHSSGQYISSVCSAPIGLKRDPQGVGSALTYLRRYALAAVAGIAQEDDDGQAAVAPKPQQRAQRPAVVDKYEGIKNDVVRLLTDADETTAAIHLASLGLTGEQKKALWPLFTKSQQDALTRGKQAHESGAA